MERKEVLIDPFTYRDPNGRKGHCAIEAIPLPDGRVVVIATEVQSNAGMSITNATEHVATAVCRHLGIDPHQLVWIEHYGYPPPWGTRARTYDRVCFEQVTPDEDLVFHRPRWSIMHAEDWHLLGLAPRR